MSGTPAEIVARLAARGIRHTYVDGGITIQRFLQAGLIQRLIITRIPIILGSGILSSDRSVAISSCTISQRACIRASFRVSMWLPADKRSWA